MPRKAKHVEKNNLFFYDFWKTSIWATGPLNTPERSPERSILDPLRGPKSSPKRFQIGSKMRRQRSSTPNVAVERAMRVTKTVADDVSHFGGTMLGPRGGGRGRGKPLPRGLGEEGTDLSRLI